MKGAPEDTGDRPEDYEYEGQVDEYISSTRLKLLFIIFLFVLCIVAALFSMSVNGRDMGIPDVIRILNDHIHGAEYQIHTTEWFDDDVVWNRALPRMLFTVLAGIGLAVAGASMQGVMNNPLADPYTAGVSAGGCLGLSIAILLGLSVNYGDVNLITIFAFIFSMIPLAAIAVLAPRTRASPSTLILAGIALSYLFNAVDTILLVTTDSETLSAIYAWHTGTLSQIRWANVPVTFACVTLGSVMILYLSRRINLLSMGDAGASSLGVDPDNLRLLCLFAIAFIVGAVVGNAGVIGFVGLITPHMVRMLIGSDNRYTIPASAFLSVFMMLLADTACRMVSVYDNIPVGSALALIGAPIFLYLVVRRNSRVW